MRGMSEYSCSLSVDNLTYYTGSSVTTWINTGLGMRLGWSGNKTRDNCIIFSYLALHMIANGYNGTLCELQQAYNLARHHIHSPLWHHAHTLVLGGATVHMATLCKVR